MIITILGIGFYSNPWLTLIEQPLQELAPYSLIFMRLIMLR